MKKTLVLAFCLLMGPVALSLADTMGGNWFIQAQGGIIIPASSQASSQLSPGFNGEALMGYSFDKIFSLGVESGYDNLPYNSNNVLATLGFSGISGLTLNLPSGTHIPLELVGQLNIPTTGVVKPFVLLGAGVAFDSFGGSGSVSYQGASANFTIPTHSYTNFELDPGFGLDFAASSMISIFIQGKVCMDFGPTSGTSQESTDSPIILVPVQAGINFALN